MTKHFSNLIKTINLQIKEVQQSASTKSLQKKSRIIIKLLNSSKKEKLYSRDKRRVTYRRKKERRYGYFIGKNASKKRVEKYI